MGVNNSDSIQSFLKELSFKGILRKMEISSWKKKLLEDVWDLKIKDGGIYFSGDTITQKIRNTAQENREELEEVIKSASNSKEEN